jgi:hypothetical protein
MSAQGKGERKRGRPKGTGGKQNLLQQHEEEVREGLKKNLRPKQIAEIICTKNLLPKATITAHQVTDWIAYHKRNKTIKTLPVTGPNVQADWNEYGNFIE